MEIHGTINPSGTRGGFLFLDKFNEHCVREIKTCFRSIRGGVDDIRIEKETAALSLISGIRRHDRASLLKEKIGKQHSQDLVQDIVRDQLEEKVAQHDPFNLQRKARYDFYDKSSGGCFRGVTIDILKQFMENRRREFQLKAKDVM